MSLADTANVAGRQQSAVPAVVSDVQILKVIVLLMTRVRYVDQAKITEQPLSVQNDFFLVLSIRSSMSSLISLGHWLLEARPFRTPSDFE